MFTLPNILTLSRIVIIPVVFALVYMQNPIARWVGCIIFTLASITDFFDGYLARKMKQVSNFGRFLDPIADKLLVGAVVLVLTYRWDLGYLGVIPAAIILCREILVSGLREFLAEIQVPMPVTKLAKWKTAFQLIALPLLIIKNYLPAFLKGLYLSEISIFLFWLAGFLTLVTGYQYLKYGLRYMK